MKISFQKVAAFFGMADATEAEVDARLDSELAKQAETNAEAGNDQVAAPTPQAADPTPEAEAEQLGNKAEITTEIAQIVATELQAALGPLNAALSSLSERLEKVEATDAAEDTDGTRQAPELEAPLYAANPITQRAAARLTGQ